MLDQIIQKLEPLCLLLERSQQNGAAVSKGLRAVFTNKASTWTRPQTQAVLNSFSPGTREAHEVRSQGKWPHSMDHILRDEPVKLYAYINTNIYMHRAGKIVCNDFVKGALRMLMSAEKVIIPSTYVLTLYVNRG